MTSKLPRHHIRIGLVLAAATCAFPAMAQDKPKTLVDLFFKKKPAPVQIVEPAPVQPVVQKPAAKPAKIAAPTFLTYVAETPKAFDLAKRIKPAADPVVTGATALPALGLVGGFALADHLDALENVSISGEKAVGDALVGLYNADTRFLWVSGTDATAGARAVEALLASADDFGLDPRDYAVAPLTRGWSPDDMNARAAELVRYDMQMTAAVMRYLRDVEGRRIDPNRLSGFHDLADKVPDLANATREIAGSADPAAALLARHPLEPAYGQLAAELKRLRAESRDEIVIAPGTLIRPGDVNPEFAKLVAVIKARADEAFLAEHGPALAAMAGEAYDPAFVPVVKAWQKAMGLGADGVIGPRTIMVTVGPSNADKINKIELALERMRWLPDDFGPRHVFINQASFLATYVNNDRPELTMNVVVGTKTNQTSFFTDTIEYVEMNPTWGMPRSILVNEYLPKLRGNPGYLDAKGYEVYDSKGRKVSSSSVNWSAYGTNVPFSIVQPSGDGNALGELKIMFPNKHAIYMHDTPARSLFSRDMRAYSHGCVRLSDPRAMAAAVLGTTKDEVGRMIAKGNHRETLPQKIPVYLTYFTAWPADDGSIAYFDDVYERDKYLGIAIDKTEAARNPGV